MYILYLIGLVMVIGGAHYVGTEWFKLPETGGAFDAWMCCAILVYSLPVIIPGAISFCVKVKNHLIEDLGITPVISFVLAIIITIMFPIIVTFAILLAIIGIHMIISAIIKMFKG